MGIIGLRMKVEIGFEETNEVETLCNVEYIEQRDNALYVEFKHPTESDDPYAVTEFGIRDNESPHSCASQSCSAQFDSRGPYIESVQRDEHEWFGTDQQP